MQTHASDFYWSDIFSSHPVKKWLGRVCTVLALSAIVCCVPPALELLKGVNTDYSGVPVLTREQYTINLERIDKELKAPATSPETYYRTISDIDQFRDELSKLIDSSVDGKVLVGHYGLGDGGFGRKNDLQQRYFEKFGQNVMAEAADAARRDHVIDPNILNHSLPQQGVNWSAFLHRFALAWLNSAVCMLGYFILRFKMHGLRILPEPLRLVFCAVFWMPCAFLYPERIDKNKQVRDALNTLGYLMGAALSFSAVAAKAGERRPEAESLQMLANVRVLCADDLPKPSYALTSAAGFASEKVTGNGVVVHPGPVSTWDLNLATPAGWNFDFSGTRALSGSPGSDELDYGIGRSWSWKGNSLSASLNYYDIQPEGTGKGGDIISPTIQVNRPLGHGWNGFAHAEADFLTHGPISQNGYLLSGGADRSDTLGHGLTLDQTFSAVYGDGPFGQKAGLVLRYQGAVSASLTDRLRIQWFKWNAFAPILGARDRKTTASASMGLSLAF